MREKMCAADAGAILEEELTAWVDADRYERSEGRREVTAMALGQSESKNACGNLLDDIKSCGVNHVDLWVTDGNQTMIDAIAQHVPDGQRQRCVKHKM